MFGAFTEETEKLSAYMLHTVIQQWPNYRKTSLKLFIICHQTRALVFIRGKQHELPPFGGHFCSVAVLFVLVQESLCFGS